MTTLSMLPERMQEVQKMREQFSAAPYMAMNNEYCCDEGMYYHLA